jgi:hypothetical protein
MEEIITKLALEIILSDKVDNKDAGPWDNFISGVIKKASPYHAPNAIISEARQTAVASKKEVARLARAEEVTAAKWVGGRAKALQAKGVDALKPKILTHDNNPSTLRSWTRQTKSYITASNIHS